MNGKHTWLAALGLAVMVWACGAAPAAGAKKADPPGIGDAAMFDRALQDPQFAKAWKAFESGNFAEAYALFGKLLRKRPDSAPVNFAYALAAQRAGQISHASLAYERILMLDPMNDRARLELGRVYVDMGLAELAREQFEQVLDHEPPDSVRENIERYMNRTQVAKKWSLNARLDVGALYDDNVNVGPLDDTVGIDPIHSGATWIDTLEVSPESQARSAGGAYASALVLGRYALGNEGAWSLFGLGNIYQTWLDGETEYELSYYRLGGGLQHAGARHIAEVPLRVERINRGYDGLVNLYGANPAYTLALNPKLHWLSTLMLERRDYTGQDDRDSNYGSLGQALRLFLGPRRHPLTGGVRVFREGARESIYSNEGPEAFATVELKPWKMLTLYGLGRYRYADYDEKEALAPERRKDRQWQWLAGATWTLNRSWGVDVNYQYILNDSNFDLYEYARNIVTGGVFLIF